MITLSVMTNTEFLVKIHLCITASRYILTTLARSSNGRTAAFEAVYLGSNPSRASMKNPRESGDFLWMQLNGFACVAKNLKLLKAANAENTLSEYEIFRPSPFTLELLYLFVKADFCYTSH